MRIPRLQLVLLALPLALGLWGAWQWQRMRGTPDGARIRVAELTALLDSLQVVARERPMEIVGQLPDSTRVTAPVAISYLRRELSALQSTQVTGRIRRRLLPVSMGFAIMALLCGGGGLLLLRQAASGAMASRDALLAGFTRARRVLPFIVTGVTVALAVSLSTLVAFEALGLWTGSLSTLSRGGAKLLMLLAAISGAVLVVAGKALLALPAALRMFTPEPMPLLGREVTRADAPGLWQWVQDLAQRAGAAPPARITVGFNDGFFVTSNPIALHPSGTTLTGTVLHLPLAELALLEQDEAAAIIGHELGHFSGEDTAYSQRFLPIYAGLSRSLDSVAAAATSKDGRIDWLLTPAWELGSWCLARFHEAVMHWSRVREFAADQVSVRVAGADASARAMVRTVACQAPVSRLFTAIRTRPEAAPANLVDALRAAAAAGDAFDDPTEHLGGSIAHPTDSHPPTHERLAAFGETLPLREALRRHATRPVDAGTPLWFAPLFADLPALVTAVSGEYIGAVSAEEAAYDEHLSALAETAREPRELTERITGTLLAFVVLAVILVPAGTALALAAGDAMLPGVAMLAGGLACLWAAWWFWQRSRQPYLRLDADGFLVHGATPLVPWTAVQDLSFTTVNQTLTTELLLDPAFQLTLGRGHRRRARWKARTHVLTLSAAGAKGMNHGQVAELVLEYWRAGNARAALAARQAARSDVGATVVTAPGSPSA